jgi:hypothetical protein
MKCPLCADTGRVCESHPKSRGTGLTLAAAGRLALPELQCGER